MNLVLPMYNVHLYFSSKIWAKSIHYTQQKTVIYVCSTQASKLDLFNHKNPRYPLMSSPKTSTNFTQVR